MRLRVFRREPRADELARLVEYVDSKDKDPSDLNWLLDIFGSGKFAMDSRDEYAKEVAATIPNDIEAKITMMAGSLSEPTPTEYFLILAHVLATESYKDILKYRDEYLGADDTLWNRNLETYLRTNQFSLTLPDLFYDSENRRDAVDKRLNDYIESGEKLAQLFNRAAATKNDPTALNKADQELLEQFGYVIRYVPSDGGKEQLVYHIPRSNRGLGEHFITARKNLALPEASFLSAVKRASLW